MVTGTKLAIGLMAALFALSRPYRSWAQDSSAHYEIGTVYYTSGGEFRPIEKEELAQGGRATYSARVKGAHASLRLSANEQVFRVCGVDPSRFRLFRFKAEKNARTVVIAKNNVWIGGSKVVLKDAEVPLTIHTADAGCYTLTPPKELEVGEFGISPMDSLDAFMFGVGEPKQSK
jgi:hypothetical protein